VEGVLLPASFYHYTYLQILDFLSTLAFLVAGVQEGNPVVRLALDYAPSPLWGLLAVKAAAMGLGLFVLRTGRLRLLNQMNVLFAVVVAWNLLALVVAAGRSGRVF
jgi:hypothetical protein